MTRKIKKTEAVAKAKVAPKPAAKKAVKAPTEKKVGIISTIIDLMSADKGATIDSMVAALSKKFSDHQPEKLRATARVQTSRQHARKEKDADGVAHYFLKK